MSTAEGYVLMAREYSDLRVVGVFVSQVRVEPYALKMISEHMTTWQVQHRWPSMVSYPTEVTQL